MASNVTSITVKDFTHIHVELPAYSAIRPGDLVEYYVDSGTLKLKPHATAGGSAIARFAREDDLQGNSVDDNYAADDEVMANVYRAGDQIHAWLADNEDVSLGDFLESNGDGCLRKVVDEDSTQAAPARALAIALEDLDLSNSSQESSGGAGDWRIKVEII